MSFIEKIQQKSEGQRRFLMLLSMIILSFLVLAIAWKSFERNLDTRLGDVAQEIEEITPGLLQSLVEDIKRIAGGEEPLTQESTITRQESRSVVSLIFLVARETRRVIRYNAGEIQKWLVEVLW